MLLTQLLIHFRGDDQFMWSKQWPLVMDAGQIHTICIGLGDSSRGECPPFTVLDTYVMR